MTCWQKADAEVEAIAKQISVALMEVVPVSLRQRVLEDAEKKRRVQLHKESVLLEQALLRAGIVTSRIPHEAFKVSKQGKVRYDVDNILFWVHVWTPQDYDEETGETTDRPEVAQLNAQLICAYPDCHRGVNWPSVTNVRRLSDLAPLFNTDDQRVETPDCGLTGKNGRPDRHNGKNDDGSDIYGFDPDEFSSLPF